MAKRTVRAVKAADGHLELLEHVDLPQGQVIPVTLELPDETRLATAPSDLPIRDLGPVKGALTRDEIYADLI
jgi:hypothetical protein